MKVGTGRLFCSFIGPSAGGAVTNGVMFLPPFAEEMNQTRSFYSQLSRRLSVVGLSALNVDLSSTGDSSGEFREASWDRWTEELRVARRWLQERTERVFLVAVRSAALYCPAMLEGDDARECRICLIDPVISGSAMIGDFLRIKVARSMFDGHRETLDSLRKQLMEGQVLEVAGYELSPELYGAINGIRVSNSEFPATAPVMVVTSKRNRETSMENEASAFFNELCSRPGTTHVPLEYELMWSNERPEIGSEIVPEVVSFLHE